MKAITVYAPWASLLAQGIKRTETRSWRTDYLGPVSIHAGRRWTRKERVVAQELHRRYPQHIPASIYQPVLGAVLAASTAFKPSATRSSTRAQRTRSPSPAGTTRRSGSASSCKT